MKKLDKKSKKWIFWVVLIVLLLLMRQCALELNVSKVGHGSFIDMANPGPSDVFLNMLLGIPLPTGLPVDEDPETGELICLDIPCMIDLDDWWEDECAPECADIDDEWDVCYDECDGRELLSKRIDLGLPEDECYTECDAEYEPESRACYDDCDDEYDDLVEETCIGDCNYRNETAVWDGTPITDVSEFYLDNYPDFCGGAEFFCWISGGEWVVEENMFGCRETWLAMGVCDFVSVSSAGDVCLIIGGDWTCGPGGDIICEVGE